jgi:ankyrin repeat protein
MVSVLAKCLTARDIRKALRSLPLSLAGMYKATLTSIDEQHYGYALKILMWLAVSPQPLRVEEARDILAVDMDAEDGPKFDPELRIADPLDVVMISSTLVAKSKRTITGEDSLEKEVEEIRLAHQTVKDFLLTSFIPPSTPSQSLFASLEEVYSFAAMICLVYLNTLCDPLTQDIVDEFPLCRLAAQFWMQYYKEADNHSAVILKSMALNLLADGSSAQYRNWCMLFNPERPWAAIDLQRVDYASSLYYASLAGLDDLVEELLKTGHGVQQLGGLHKTPLAAACYAGHFDIARILLGAGAAPNHRDISGSWSTVPDPLCAAAQQGRADIVRLLLDNGADVSGGAHRFMETPLVEAARKGHVEIVTLLLDAGADAESFHPKGRGKSALTAAVESGRSDCVAVLLPLCTRRGFIQGMRSAFARGSREMIDLFVESVTRDADAVYSAAHFAAKRGYGDIVLRLLDTRGQEVDPRMYKGQALVEACKTGHFDVVNQLIAAGADVNAQGGQPLSVAARRGQLETVKLLIQHEASIDACPNDLSHGLPLEEAARGGHKSVVECLISQGVSPRAPSPNGGPVQAAVQGNNVDMMELLLRLGADVNELPTTSGWTAGSALAAAASRSSIEMVDWLLLHGADPNLFKENSDSPLAIAAKAGDMQLVDRLLDAGAEINSESASGSPLRDAIEGVLPPVLFDGSHVDVVNRLLAAGADPNTSGDHQGYGQSISALAMACMGPNADIVSALVDAGADLRKYSKFHEWEEPPIHTAARCGTAEVVNTLVQHGADVNEQLQEGWTPLHHAIRRFDSDGFDSDYFDFQAWPTFSSFAELNKVKGAQKEEGEEGEEERAQVDHVESSSLQSSRSVGEAIVHDLLFKHGANPALTLINGSQPIHSAASHDRPQYIKLLLEAGVDVNARNHSGRTALHWAAESGSPQAVQFLLDHHADRDIEEYGTLMRARDLAEHSLKETEGYNSLRRKNLEKIITLLKSKEGKGDVESSY